jgi:hypothetical protein
MSAAAANIMLNALYAAGYRWVKLHTGDPGPNGTANAAAETNRQQITSAAAAGGALTSTADMVWSAVAGTETWRYITLWSASSGGTFGASGTIVPKSVTAGDDATVPAGSAQVVFPVAA